VAIEVLVCWDLHGVLSMVQDAFLPKLAGAADMDRSHNLHKVLSMPMAEP
jgi:hypothetical protein